MSPFGQSGGCCPATLMQRNQELRGLRLSFRSGLLRSARGRALFVTALLVASGKAGATDFDNLFAGTNDFGNVGLMQTPTARMRQDGEFGLGVSTVKPYNQIHLFLQPLPWLETSVRYTDVTNQFYSNDPGFSGTQHYKDKSADLKVRLLTEGRYWPSVAIGAQDIGGTGLFSSEYIVSSYHYFDFDFSFGLGWGRLGAGGGIRNPFALVSDHFDKERANTTGGSAGSTGFKRLFTGHDIGPFGGVEWNSPIKGLAVRLEYDGNDYQHEAFAQKFKQNSPVNFGLAYRGLPGLDLGVGYERGTTVMGRVAIYTNFQNFRGLLKVADPQPMQVLPVVSHATSNIEAPKAQAQDVVPAADASPDGKSAAADAGPTVVPSLHVSSEIGVEDEHAFVLKLKQELKQQGFTLIATDYDEHAKEIRTWFSQDRYRNPAKAAGRAARVLCATAPREISKFTLIDVEQGAESYRVLIERESFEKVARNEEDLDTAISAVRLTGPGNGFGGAEYIDDSRFPTWDWDMGPAVRQSVGGPDGFYFGQLYWKVGGSVSLTDHLKFTGAAGFNIINNFDKIKLQSNSSLPHVRSDIVKYLQQGKDGVINLEADYVWSPAPDWYHRVSLGIFEEMYGGAATELLYRPYGRSWAVALDINRVKKRGYDEQFDFLPYEVTTGHATLYYKPGYYNLLFKLSAGQYLAGDKGATMDISREFDSGVRVGIFATKTNVSAAEFGEGSFDKGIYLTLPLDLFFAQSTRRQASFAFRPLTRDGGQMVYDGPELYYTLQDGQPSDFAEGASELLK